MTLAEAAAEAWTFLPVLTSACTDGTTDLHRDALLLDVCGDLLDAMTEHIDHGPDDADYAFIGAFVDLFHANHEVMSHG